MDYDSSKGISSASYCEEITDPQGLVPEQFFSDSLPPSSERSLVRALFAEAANSLRRKELRSEALKWIQGKDTNWPFSFENACEVLNLEPSWMRKKFEELASKGPERRVVRRENAIHRRRIKPKAEPYHKTKPH